MAQSKPVVSASDITAAAAGAGAAAAMEETTKEALAAEAVYKPFFTKVNWSHDVLFYSLKHTQALAALTTVEAVHLAGQFASALVNSSVDGTIHKTGGDCATAAKAYFTEYMLLDILDKGRAVPTAEEVAKYAMMCQRFYTNLTRNRAAGGREAARRGRGKKRPRTQGRTESSYPPPTSADCNGRVVQQLSLVLAAAGATSSGVIDVDADSAGSGGAAGPAVGVAVKLEEPAAEVKEEPHDELFDAPARAADEPPPRKRRRSAAAAAAAAAGPSSYSASHPAPAAAPPAPATPGGVKAEPSDGDAGTPGGSARAESVDGGPPTLSVSVSGGGRFAFRMTTEAERLAAARKHVRNGGRGKPPFLDVGTAWEQAKGSCSLCGLDGTLKHGSAMADHFRGRAQQRGRTLILEPLLLACCGGCGLACGGCARCGYGVLTGNCGRSGYGVHSGDCGRCGCGVLCGDCGRCGYDVHSGDCGRCECGVCSGDCGHCDAGARGAGRARAGAAWCGGCRTARRRVTGGVRVACIATVSERSAQ
eukprot:gene8556-1054_t